MVDMVWAGYPQRKRCFVPSLRRRLSRGGRTMSPNGLAYVNADMLRFVGILRASRAMSDWRESPSVARAWGGAFE